VGQPFIIPVSNSSVTVLQLCTRFAPHVLANFPVFMSAVFPQFMETYANFLSQSSPLSNIASLNTLHSSQLISSRNKTVSQQIRINACWLI